MQIEKIDGSISLNSKDWVKVTTCGNVVEVMYSEHKSRGNDIRKISAEQYINITTGEVCDYKHTVNRAQNKNELRKTFKRIRDVINCNVDKPNKCRWVTLTYAENMTDTKRLYEDTKKFIMRLRYEVGHFEYIQVAEPQGRGAWHIHMIMIFDKQAPFIDNRKMAAIWGHGTTDTQKLDDNDNLGAYLSAYLGDIPLEDVKDINTAYMVNGLEVKEVGGKKYIKGGRLHMYPTKFNILRCSRGVKRPTVETMTYENAQKKVSAGTLTFEKSLSLIDEEKDFNNFINYKYYNMAREPKQ